MSTISIRDQRLAGATMLPDEFVDYYLPQANGDYVKIYLYLLRSVHGSGTPPTIASLADVFRLTERDVKRALTYWNDAGLLELEYKGDELESIVLLPVSQTLRETQKDPIAEKLAAEEIFPEHADAQVSSSRMKELRTAEASREDIRTILFFAQQYLRHPLNSTDIRRLSYLYDELHMSVDLIDYLVEYCVSRDGRNMAYIMKVGLAWHDEGIRTVKEAKTRNQASMNNYYKIFKFFGISGRAPVPGEIEDMDRWMRTYNFPFSIIEEAASRTIRKTGKPSFPYAERILSDWHKAGVRNAGDIASLDEKHKAQQKPSVTAGTSAKKSANKFSNFPQRQDEEHKKLVEALIKQQ